MATFKTDENFKDFENFEEFEKNIMKNLNNIQLEVKSYNKEKTEQKESKNKKV